MTHQSGWCGAAQCGAVRCGAMRRPEKARGKAEETRVGTGGGGGSGGNGTNNKARACSRDLWREGFKPSRKVARECESKVKTAKGAEEAGRQRLWLQRIAPRGSRPHSTHG